jgi:hypothetical protein
MPQTDRSHYFTFLASANSSKAQSPAAQSPPISSPIIRPPGNTKILAPFATGKADHSPWSSTLSHDSQTSLDPPTTRSTTPGTLSSGAHQPLYAHRANTSPDPVYPQTWPPKAAHLLGAQGPSADSPTIRTGPSATESLFKTKKEKSSKPKKKRFQFSTDMETAYGSKPTREKPPVLLDIGPSEKHGRLKAGANFIKKPFQSEGILMQVFSGGDGRRGYR